MCGCGVHVIMDEKLQYFLSWNSGNGSNSLAEARALAGLLVFCVFFWYLEHFNLWRFKNNDGPCKGSLPHQWSSIHWVDGQDYVFLEEYETVLNLPHLPFPKCSSWPSVKEGADFRVWFLVYVGFWWRTLLLHPGLFHPWIMNPSYHLFVHLLYI